MKKIALFCMFLCVGMLFSYGGGDDKFVAVSLNGDITISTDGTTWTEQARVGNIDWSSITCANEKFVMVGDRGYITTSTDGTTWTTPVQVGRFGWNSVIFANGKFVAVGYKTVQHR